MFINIEIRWGKRRGNKEHKASWSYDSPERQPKKPTLKPMPESRTRIEYKRKNDITPLGFSDNYGCYPQ